MQHDTYWILDGECEMKSFRLSVRASHAYTFCFTLVRRSLVVCLCAKRVFVCERCAHIFFYFATILLMSGEPKNNKNWGLLHVKRQMTSGKRRAHSQTTATYTANHLPYKVLILLKPAAWCIYNLLCFWYIHVSFRVYELTVPTRIVARS